MSEPIDLNLVELRCRLRGWPCVRKRELMLVDTPGGEVEVTATGGASYNGLAEPFGVALDAPRWTLDRLLSAPPEGWTCQWSLGDAAKFCRDGVDVWLWLIVKADTLRSGVEMDFGTTTISDLARLAERLRAAAELALILAEVEL